MLKLPFALETKYTLLDYPFKIKGQSSFKYKNKEYNTYIMEVDNCSLSDFKNNIYAKFVKNKCISRNLPIKHISTMKYTTDKFTQNGLKNFYLFNAKYVKYLKAIGITETISLNKTELKYLSDKDIGFIKRFLMDNFKIHNKVDNTIEIDLGKPTLSVNCLLLVSIFEKVIKLCNKDIDLGTDFYKLIDKLNLSLQEKALINSKLKDIDNTYFYIFEEN